MEANELRVGNLVYYFDRTLPIPIQKIIAIETITEGGVNHLFAEEGLYEKEFKDLNPIPLTPEWLEKFGFDEDGRTMSLDDDKYELCLERKGNEIWVICSSGYPQEIKKLEYVHEVQNVFSSLKGKELEIKSLHISGE